jgi:hypothetical protein
MEDLGDHAVVLSMPAEDYARERHEIWLGKRPVGMSQWLPYIANADYA